MPDPIRDQRSAQLPALPIGESTATSFLSAREFGDAIDSAGKTAGDFLPAGPDRDFRGKLAQIPFADLHVAVSAMSAHMVVCEIGDSVTLGLVTAGSFRSRSRLVTQRIGPGVMCITGPGTVARFETEAECSGIVLACRRSRLLAVAHIMLGLPESGAEIEAPSDRCHIVPAVQGLVDVGVMLQSLLTVAERYRHEPRALAACGIEDALCRQMVLAIWPQRFLTVDGRGGRGGRDRGAVELLCEWIRGHLDQPITLSDMERVSELSARALQLAFQRRFGMTPGQWVREQRLLFARTLLLEAGNRGAVTTIADVARQAGFGNGRALQTWYRRRFGEPPAVTLFRASRR